MNKAQVVPGEADAELDAVLDSGAAYAQRRASQVNPMRGAVAAEAAPRRLLPAAVGQLAHDLRASLHAIRGHAELLAREATDDDARESSRHIIEASARLGALSDDLVDFLRLPRAATGEQVPFEFEDLERSLQRVAVDRGVQLHVVGPGDAPLGLGSTVRRVVSHLLDHAVRSVASDLTIVATFSFERDACVITVTPAPPGAAEGEDAIVEIATALLEGRGGELEVVDDRIDLVFPVVG